MACNHFWEIDFSTLDNKKPTFTCMHCGKKKKDSIPILDEKILSEALQKGDAHE